MSAAITDDSTFLRALAHRIGTRLVVFVPNTRSPRSLWISTAGDPSQIQRLETFGRAWLARPTSGPPSVEDRWIAVAPVRTRDAQVVGALLAAKSPGEEWTRPELGLVRFAAEFYGPALDQCAQRPRPQPWLLHDESPPGTTISTIEGGMRTASANGELYLVYQPEIDMTTGECVAVEALLRWEHPERGELGPESFIAVAEQSDLINVMGDWVVVEAMREFAGWIKTLPETDVSLRVNVSPVQITDADVVSLFADTLAETGLRGDQICVEITEHAAAADVAELSATLTALKELGIRSAIDDLATGYSTLSRLRYLPVDIVKVDRSLVTDIDDDARAQSIVSAVLTLAADLGIEVIAEGVENAAEAEMLVKMGCLRAQGHLFGRPMPAAEILDVLRRSGRRHPA